MRNLAWLATPDYVWRKQGASVSMFFEEYHRDLFRSHRQSVCKFDQAAFLFGSSIDLLDLVFSKGAGNLVVSRHGSTDTIAIANWDSGAAYQTEVFRAADGSTLLNGHVDQLIQAMAQFSAENGGITWDQAIDQRPEDVQVVLASYWQSAA